MVSSAKAGYGTLFQAYYSGGYNTIAEVRSIRGPSITRSVMDVTNMDSPARWREYIAGLPDGGEVSFDVNFLPLNATQQKMFALGTNAVTTFKLNWTTAGDLGFNGIVTGVTPAASVEEPLRATITVKINGAVGTV